MQCASAVPHTRLPQRDPGEGIFQGSASLSLRVQSKPEKAHPCKQRVSQEFLTGSLEKLDALDPWFVESTEHSENVPQAMVSPTCRGKEIRHTQHVVPGPSTSQKEQEGVTRVTSGEPGCSWHCPHLQQPQSLQQETCPPNRRRVPKAITGQTVRHRKSTHRLSTEGLRVRPTLLSPSRLVRLWLPEGGRLERGMAWLREQAARCQLHAQLHPQDRKGAGPGLSVTNPDGASGLSTNSLRIRCLSFPQVHPHPENQPVQLAPPKASSNSHLAQDRTHPIQGPHQETSGQTLRSPCPLQIRPQSDSKRYPPKQEATPRGCHTLGDARKRS